MNWPADHREPVKWVEGVSVFDHGAMVACDQLVEAGFQLRVEDSKQALDSWILKLRGVMKHARLTRAKVTTRDSKYRVNIWEWYQQDSNETVFIINAAVLNDPLIDPFAPRPGMDEREIHVGPDIRIYDGRFSSALYASAFTMWRLPTYPDYATENTGLATQEELDSRGDVPPTTEWPLK